MNRRDLVAAAIASSMGGMHAAHGQAAFVEGRHYSRLPRAVATDAGTVEVLEFFWYGCPHCDAFEPALNAWAKRLARPVSFRHVHVNFRPNMTVHQRLYYTLEAMGQEARLRPAIFDAVQRKRQRLDDVTTATAFVASQGIDAAKFRSVYDSFGVQSKCQTANKLMETYGVDQVPLLAIGGRYLTGPAMATGGANVSEAEAGQRAVQVADFLIQKVRSGG